MKVTDRDRKAQLLAHCNSLLDGIPSNGHGYYSSRDAAHRKTRKLLAAAIAQAREEGRAEEREACIAAIRKACPRAHTYASENADIYKAQDHMVDMAIAAIRARGED